MVAVARRFPEDQHIVTLAAEALMDLTPWDYWEAGGETPKGRTAEIVALLESVLKLNPAHPGAIHFYIHAVEASNRPERAEPYADRLAAMELGAGHLVHMPSHIYFRVGRYGDSLAVNRRAVQADESFFAKVKPEGLYAGGYYPHNIHFLMVSAQMSGDGATALSAAEKLDASVADDAARAMPGFVQPIKAAPILAHAQFSDAGKISRSRSRRRICRTSWRCGTTLAVLPAPRWEICRAPRQRWRASTRFCAERTGRRSPRRACPPQTCSRSLAKSSSAASPRPAATPLPPFGLSRLPSPSKTSSPTWSRHSGLTRCGQSLGAALLQAGDIDGAERSFRAALEAAPNSGWALFGLHETLARRGESAERIEVARRLDRYWVGDRALLSLAKL
jgi:tetratricopeptide (TPR) repeat protein